LPGGRGEAVSIGAIRISSAASVALVGVAVIVTGGLAAVLVGAAVAAASAVAFGAGVNVPALGGTRMTLPGCMFSRSASLMPFNSRR